MILIIGGAFQGKTEYVKNHFGVKIEEIYDAYIPENTDGEHVCINHLHEYIKAQLKEGKDPEEEIMRLAKLPNTILICDEIGNGIVPVDSFERRYRQRTGRILIQAAKEADEIIRVMCAIGQKIK